jgi:hypothetical protein
MRVRAVYRRRADRGTGTGRYGLLGSGARLEGGQSRPAGLLACA